MLELLNIFIPKSLQFNSWNTVPKASFIYRTCPFNSQVLLRLFNISIQCLPTVLFLVTFLSQFFTVAFALASSNNHVPSLEVVLNVLRYVMHLRGVHILNFQLYLIVDVIIILMQNSRNRMSKMDAEDTKHNYWWLCFALHCIALQYKRSCPDILNYF